MPITDNTLAPAHNTRQHDCDNGHALTREVEVRKQRAAADTIFCARDVYARDRAATLVDDSKHMDHFGDEAAGFSIDFDAGAGAVSVRAWGFWGAEVARAFGPAVREACQQKPAGTVVRMDMKELKPMREEGQLSFGSIVAELPALGIAQLKIQTASQLTKLQLIRISTERGKSQFVQVE